MPSRRIAVTCLLLLSLSATTGRGDEWPQWRGPHRDGVWHETGIVEKFESDQIEPLWRQPVGSGYSGPTVAEGNVYVTDRLVEPQQVERVHCFDWNLGTKLWTRSYPCEYTISYEAGPRASVTVEDGRAFALGAMGHLHCLDAASGQVLWKHDLDAEFKISADKRMPIWGIAGSPLIYEDLVIVPIGAEKASLVAFNKKFGDLVWQALDDRAQYSAPILIEQAGRPVLEIGRAHV